MKFVLMLMFCVEIAYSASDGKNVPPSKVDVGAMVRLAAPRIVTNSYTLPPFTTSPSTSKNVVYIEWNGGIDVLVLDRTKRKSNSAARVIVGVPSLQLAVVASSVAPDSQMDGRIPKPRHAKPALVKMACVVYDDCGFQYSIATVSE